MANLLYGIIVRWGSSWIDYCSKPLPGLVICERKQRISRHELHCWSYLILPQVVLSIGKQKPKPWIIHWLWIKPTIIFKFHVNTPVENSICGPDDPHTSLCWPLIITSHLSLHLAKNTKRRRKLLRLIEVDQHNVSASSYINSNMSDKPQFR